VTSLLAQLTPVQAALLIGVRIRALGFRLRDPILGDAVSAQLAESIGVEVIRLTIPTSVVHLNAVRAKTPDEVALACGAV
jgi:hypothetical protein